MQLTPAAEALLLPPERAIGNWMPDDYDISFGDIVKPYREVESAEVGLVGVPSDTNCLQRRGSRNGPSAIRENLKNSCTYEFALEADLSDLTVAEFGDADVVLTDPVETEERVVTISRGIHEAGVLPIALGGDHSHTFACIKALCEVTDGKVGVIFFDAHHDVRVSLHGERNSGVGFRRMLEELDGAISGANVVGVGMNGWYMSRMYADYLVEKEVNVISARDVHLRGIHTVVEEAIAAACDGVEAVYCTVDIDCLEIPGTNVPSPGGVTSFELLEGVYRIAQEEKVKAFDLMEVAPLLDPTGLTPHVAASVVTQFIGGVAQRSAKASGKDAAIATAST